MEKGKEMEMEIQMFEKVIALSNVGSGSKSHIVEVFVGEPQIRHGRSSNTYSQPHVYCGSVRGWGNTAWGVTEISNRFDFEETKKPNITIFEKERKRGETPCQATRFY
jgi:hypothetical protein